MKRTRQISYHPSKTFALIALAALAGCGLDEPTSEPAADPGDRNPAAAIAEPAGDHGQILAMHRVDAARAIVLTDSALLATRDSGATFTAITPPGGLGDGRAAAAYFLDGSQGWLASVDAGQLVIQTTGDGGQSWSRRAVTASTLEAGDVYARTQLHFADARHGWLLGQIATSAAMSAGQLFRTVDGGKTWQPLPSPPSAGPLLFVDDQRGFMTSTPVAENLYATEDGGQTWRRLSLAGDRALYRMPVFRAGSTTHGRVAVTVPGKTAELVVLATADGGRTFTKDRSIALPGAEPDEPVPAAFGPDGGLVAVAVAGDVIAAAAADEGLARPYVSGLGSVRALSFDSTSGWAVVANGACERGTCVQTTRLIAFDTSSAGSASTPRDLLQRSVSSTWSEPGDGDIGALGSTISFDKGFDKCQAASATSMQTWRTYSPYRDANIYYGGSARACSQPNLTASWVSTVFAQGWRLIPTWVGPQAPCTAYSSKFSYNVTTARNQGLNQANAAVDAAVALGLGSGTPLYYDLENYNETNLSCTNSVRAFVNAWVEQIKARGYLAGVYGNAYDAAHDWASIANPPQAVWIASWVCGPGTTSCNWSPTVWGIPGLSNGLWVSSQRIRQYWGGHNETYGGVTFNIDANYANGPVATAGGSGGSCGSSCTQCTLDVRTDILPFYQANGWDTSCWNRDNIVNNWCGIDPAGCNAVQTGACAGVCTGSTCGSPCTQCVLGVRTDILPFYQANGWDTSCWNRDSIVNNWCGIDPAGCNAVKTGSCSSVCSP